MCWGWLGNGKGVVRVLGPIYTEMNISVCMCVGRTAHLRIHVQIQRGGEGRGPDPLENHKLYWFL